MAQEVVLRPAVQCGSRSRCARRWDTFLLLLQARHLGGASAAVGISIVTGWTAGVVRQLCRRRCGVEAAQRVSSGGGGGGWRRRRLDRGATPTTGEAAVAARLPPPQQRHQPRLAAGSGPESHDHTGL